MQKTPFKTRPLLIVDKLHIINKLHVINKLHIVNKLHVVCFVHNRCPNEQKCCPPSTRRHPHFRRCYRGRYRNNVEKNQGISPHHIPSKFKPCSPQEKHVYSYVGDAI